MLAQEILLSCLYSLDLFSSCFFPLLYMTCPMSFLRVPCFLISCLQQIFLLPGRCSCTCQFRIPFLTCPIFALFPRRVFFSSLPAEYRLCSGRSLISL